jgi:hypothetical protein
MKRTLFLLVISALFFLPALAVAGDTFFYPVDIYIDTGEMPLAAWQFEVLYDGSDINIVGIEGGEEPFAEAPYYDPAGLTEGRIVIAAFTTGNAPPRGRTRVARLHLMEEGDGEGGVRVRLIVTAGPGGETYEAEIDAVRERGGNHE